MCRIVGILNYECIQCSSVKSLINRLTDELSHGGPDDRGTYFDDVNRVALGHRRLSILDLSSAGRQPMSNEDCSVHIVFNGEIYNFRELREELVTSGYSFFSNTDTEVILKAYIEWGTESFSKLSGMFSFCVYDRKKSRTYLVRDKSGIKPLYYSLKNNGLIFTSETKTFRQIESSWDENSNWKIYFLIFGFIPEPFTTLDKVYMLPEGSYLEYDNNLDEYYIVKYDEYKFSENVSDFHEAAINVEELIELSVQRHLVSDAPIGVFLSGGIDSSIIAHCASECEGNSLNTLSIVFDEEGYSEKKYQDLLVEQTGSKHSSFLLKEKEFIDSLDNIFTAMDQPTTDGINTYFISKYARESGFKTVLSGLGADELFGGYPSFERFRKLWFLGKVNRGLKNVFSIFDIADNERLKKLSFLCLKSPLSFYLVSRGIYNADSVAGILDTDKKQVLECLENIDSFSACALDSGNTAFLMESDMYMKNQLLRDTDFMSMRNAVEVRVPFLDQDLVRYVMSVSSKTKFSSKIPKILLRKAFSNRIPVEILNRKKKGFVIPIEHWIKNNVDLFSEMIGEKNGKIKNSIEEFRSGRLHWSRFWSLVVLNRKSI